MKPQTTFNTTTPASTDSETEVAQASERRADYRLFSILVIDINDFARFNERYGRETSDRILEQFADFIKALFRKTDVFARTRNDIFAVLLAKTDQAGALAAAHRLQAAIALHHWEEETLTVNVGAATSKPATTDAESVTQEAELALQQAKAYGAGHVVHYDRISPSGDLGTGL
jgi:diguanylate cyclase (GGDEF)-like protein